MASVATNRLVYGREEPDPKPIELAQETIKAIVEPETGWLRYVCLHGIEAIRAIYPSLRGPDWGTKLAKISKLRSEEHGDTTEVRFNLLWDTAPFLAHGEANISLDRNGTLVYRLVIEADGEFQTNRTGLCVLHPRTLAGKRVEIGHPGGECERSTFPNLIAPQQPFTDITSVACEPYPGSEVHFTFEGELFEMEDQRLYGDPSFKTYVYPQASPTKGPMPYTIAKGQRLEQTVTVTLKGGEPARPEPTPKHFSTPKLATLVRNADGKTVDELQKLGLKTVVVTDAAAAQPLHQFRPVVVLNEPAPIPEGATLAITPPRKDGPKESLAATLGLFADLNTGRPKDAERGAMWGNHPQVHAFDKRTLFEAPEGYADQVRTARSFAKGEIVLGPLELSPGRGIDDDPRWNSLVGVGWTLAAIAGAALAQPNLCVLSSLDRLRGTLPSLVVQDLAEGEIVGFEGSKPYELTVIHLRVNGRSRVLVANTLPWERPLILPAMAPDATGARSTQILDAANVEFIAKDLSKWGSIPPAPVPTVLQAHAYLRIDG